MISYKIEGSHKEKAYKLLKKKSEIFPVGLPEILQQSFTIR